MRQGEDENTFIMEPEKDTCKNCGKMVLPPICAGCGKILMHGFVCHMSSTGIDHYCTIECEKASA